MDTHRIGWKILTVIRSVDRLFERSACDFGCGIVNQGGSAYTNGHKLSFDLAAAIASGKATKALKIAHLALSALPGTIGGLEVVVDSLLRQQKAAGHDARLVTRWQQARAIRSAGLPYPALALPPWKGMSKVPFKAIGPKWPVAAAVRWHQSRHQFDLWHIHWLYPTAWMAFETLRAMDVPMLVTAHGGDINQEPSRGFGFRQFPEHDRRIRDLAGKISAVSAISPSLRESLLEIGVSRDAIFDIPNGVDATRLNEAVVDHQKIKESLAIGSSTKMVLSVGRNDANKGFDRIPLMLEMLLERGIDATWVIVGRDSDRLGPEFAKRGLSDRVRLLPAVAGSPQSGYSPPQGLAELYSAADVLVSTSSSEGFGLVLLEAMACETPVIGFNVPGVRDVITHGSNGFLVEHDDHSGMVDALAGILGDPSITRGLVESGSQTAAKLDWKQVSSEYTALYSKLIARNAK